MNSASLASGIGALGRALRLLQRRRELWAWCALPLAINLVAFGVAATVFFGQLDALTEAVQRMLAAPTADVWYAWFWVGPLRALAWVARVLLVLVFAAAVYVLFTVVGGVIAAPFLDVLSARVERIATGAPEVAVAGGWAATLRGSARALREEAKRAFFFLALQAGLVAVGLVPGLQIPAALAALGVAALFVPLDYAGYALDRRGASFRERRAWLWRHKAGMLGFGGAGLLTFAIPGLNFLCLPLLVSAGTLLAVDTWDAPPPTPEAGSGETR